MKPEPQEMLEQIKQLARKAGKVILDIYEQGDYQLEQKDDDSPVTSADYAANEIIVAGLKAINPHIPIISEESNNASLAKRNNWNRFWLIDPMDGTQEFVSRSGDFAVNIALVDNGWPVMGVIYWPVQDVTYYAIEGKGAFKESDRGIKQLQVTRSTNPQQPVRIAVSRVQKRETVTRFLYESREFELVSLGSCSLKSCYVAEGKADCYMRIGPTGEWDTGASHCIVEEAGGRILDSEFNALSYNQRDTFGNPDFMVLGDQTFDWQHIIKPHKTSRKL